MAHPDLLIVGGGIIGCSAAAFAAERGASVVLVEATEIGAGASGRNSGVVQHPFDPVLAPLHEATLEHYRALADGGFAFPAEPAGLLLLTDDAAAGHARVAELNASEPSLAAAFLDEPALRQREPMLAGGLSAVLLATGYPIPPHAATQAMAARAERAGAELRLGVRVAAIEAGPALRLEDGSSLEAGAILVATGPWSAELLDPTGAWRPIRPTYGVTVQVALSPTPASVLEEGAVHTVNRPVAEDEPDRRPLHLLDGHRRRRQHRRLHLPAVGARSRRPSPRSSWLTGRGSCRRWPGRPSCGAASAPARSRSTGARSSVRSTAWIASS